MVSSTEGSWCILAGTAAPEPCPYSMYLRYSSSVVAPMACNSPRASAGLIRLEASVDPSAAPAPTIVCSSSMNRMIWPSDFTTSFDHGLQPLLELTAEFRGRRSRNRYPATATACHGAILNVAADDPLGKSFHDGGLADTGLTDEHRIVLRPSRQHLHDTPDLLVTADDRIELALPGQRRHVLAVFFPATDICFQDLRR